MSNENDLRIRKTRKLIREAFIKLLDMKGFNGITINNIADMESSNNNRFAQRQRS